jgi:hypothetical protein
MHFVFSFAEMPSINWPQVRLKNGKERRWEFCVLLVCYVVLTLESCLLHRPRIQIEMSSKLEQHLSLLID